MQKKQEESNLFQPKINKMSKNLKRSEIDLYQDTTRRQSVLQQKQMKAMQQVMNERNSVQITSKSDKVMFDKFNNAFIKACFDTQILQPDTQATDIHSCGESINSKQMYELFYQMGFVQENVSPMDQKLLTNMWKELGGDDEELIEVPLQHVNVYMCAIQNFHIDWIVDFDRDQDYQGFSRIGDDGNLYLTPNEITAITKKYIRFYKNRQVKMHKDRSEQYKQQSNQKKKFGEEPTLHPKINEKSLKRTASRSNSRIEDRLMQSKQELTQKKAQMRMKQIQDEDNQPYNPQISVYSKKMARKKSVTVKSINGRSDSSSKWENLHA